MVFNDGSLLLEDKNLKLEVIARLKSGITLQQAQADMNAIARGLERDYPATNNGRDIKLVPLRESHSQNENVFEIKMHLPANTPVETRKGK